MKLEDNFSAELLLEVIRRHDSDQQQLQQRVAEMDSTLEQRITFWGKIVTGVVTGLGIAFIVVVGTRVWTIEGKLENVQQSALALVDRASLTTTNAEQRLAKVIEEANQQISGHQVELQSLIADSEKQLNSLVRDAERQVDEVKSTRREVELALDEQQRSAQELFQDYISIKKGRPSFEADRAEVLKLLAETSAQQGDIAKAISYIRKALDSEIKGEPGDFHDLGVVAIDIDQRELALKVFQSGSTRFPDDRQLKRDVASSIGRTPDVETAERLYKELVEADPSDTESIGSFADFYQRNNRYDDALALLTIHLTRLEEAGAASRNLAILYRELGTTYALKGLSEKAATHFKKAIESDPSDDVTYGLLATRLAMDAQDADDAELEKKLFVEALEQVNKGIEQNQGRSDGRLVQYHTLKAGILQELDMHDKSIEALYEALRILPGDMDTRATLATLLRSRGRQDEALQVLLGNFGPAPNQAPSLAPESTDIESHLDLNEPQVPSDSPPETTKSK